MRFVGSCWSIFWMRSLHSGEMREGRARIFPLRMFCSVAMTLLAFLGSSKAYLPVTSR